MDKNFLERYTLEQMRLQRHDFMNDLQVIYGYIQISKPEEAVRYIKNINKYMAVISRIYNLECDTLGLLFQEFISKCNKLNIEIELDLKIEYISCEHFSKDIEKKKKLFDINSDKILDAMNVNKAYGQKLHIIIDGLAEDFNVAISSSETLNNENYYNYMLSAFQFEKNAGEIDSFMFCKNDSYISLLLNFK